MTARAMARSRVVLVLMLAAAALVAVSVPRDASAGPGVARQPGATVGVPDLPTAATVMVGTATGTTPVSASSAAELGRVLVGASPAVEAAARAFFAAGGTSLMVVPTPDGSVRSLAAAMAAGGALDRALSAGDRSLLVVPEIGALDQSPWLLVAAASVEAATRHRVLALLDPSQALMAPVAALPPAGQTNNPGAVYQVVESLAGAARELRNAVAAPEHGVLYAGSLTRVVGQGPVMPTAAVMAGVTARSDAAQGIWDAPAGVSYPLTGWVPQLLVDNAEQGTLGAAGLNVVRVYPTLGTLMWGARTLSPDSQLRYISVARTYLWIERSLQPLLDSAAFSPNTATTWARVVGEASAFLTSLWEQGGLTGATAADAYTVEMGLGTTMSADDILNGYMRMSVSLDMVHPAVYEQLDLVTEVAG